MSREQLTSFGKGDIHYHRDILEHAPVMIWITDQTGACIYLNKQWTEYTGRPLEQDLGLGWMDNIHPEDVPTVKEAFLQASRQGKLFSKQYRLKRADGIYRWMIDSGKPQYDSDGSFIGFIGSVIDITEQKEHEHALREKETRLRFAIDAQQVGDWDLEISSMQFSHSLKFDQLFGFEEKQNRWTYTTFLSRFHPDDQPLVDHQFRAAIEKVEEIKLEAKIYWPNGSIRWIWVRGGIHPGNPNRIIGSVADISVSKQAREALQEQIQITNTVLNNATACLVMMDPEGRCTYMNPAAEKVTGYTFEEIKGKILHDVIHHTRPDGRPFPMRECPIGRSLFQHHSFQAHEEVFIRKDGRFFPVICAARPVLNNGVMIGNVMEFRDITEEKSARKAILRKADREMLIQRVAETASRSFDIEAISEVIAREVGTFFGADRCLVILVYPDESGTYYWNKIIGQYRSSEDLSYVDEQDIPRRGNAPIQPEPGNNYALRLRITTPADFPPQFRDYQAKYHIQSSIAYEIYYKNNYYGRFVLHHCTHTHEWTDEETRLIEEIVTLLGSAIHQTELYRKEQTARKEAERQRTLLHELFMQAPAMICTFRGPDHVHELINPVYQRFFGTRELAGLTIREALPELESQGIIDLLNHVYYTGESYSGRELSIKLDRGDGVLKTTYFNLILQPIKDVAGKTEGILVFAYDVTEQVLARNLVEDSAERLKLVLDALPHMAWTASPNGHTNYINQRWRTYTGQAVPDGKSLDEESVLNPDGLAEIKDAWRQSIATGKLFEKEILIRRYLDNTYRWHLTRAVPIRNEDGEIILWVGTCTDTHDLKLAHESLSKARQEFQFLADFIPQLVWRTEPSGEADYFNRRWYEYTGLTYEDCKGYGWTSCLHPDDYQRTWEVWQKSVRTGNEYQVEYRFRKADGTYRWLLAIGVPLHDQEDNIVKWFGTCTDIHDQKIMMDDLAYTQKTLSERNQQLLKINADLDSFVYAASHDLKSPVSNLEGLVALLAKRLRSKLTDGDQEIIDYIFHSSNKLKKTINELTEVTKISKEIDEPAEPVLFDEVLEDVKEDLRTLISDAGATIQSDFTVPELTYPRKHLRSIIYNLVSNAIKYRSPEKTPHVEITSQPFEDRVLLTVTDNGLGIAPEQMSKLFTMFKRMHDHVEGSGVGLYMIKRIIENNGGSVQVASALGKGTIFNVIF